MKKILIYSTAILFSLLSFVGCKNGDDITTEDAFNGTWQYTSTYSIVNGYDLSSSVTNGETYSFDSNHVLYIMGDTVNQKGSYSVKDGIISYTDESGSYKTKEYKIQGNKLYIYESTTTATGGTSEKGFILTRKSSVVTTTNSSTSLIGTWKDTKDYLIINGIKTDTATTPDSVTFNSDGTFVSVGSNFTVPDKGTYTVSGNKITITSSTDASYVAICYYKFENENLNLYQINSDLGIDITAGGIFKRQ
ncbi:MAG: hypothetical protein P4L28_09190 [Paludibacteraceae bacterium]|nr:hypothetical protein [Paludibacteraceae bacterium]